MESVISIVQRSSDYTFNGLIHDSTGGISGNGLLYTAEWVLALSNLSLLSPSNRIKFVGAYNSHMRIEGLMMRTPSNAFGQEGPDDYFGVAAASKVLDHGTLAKAILEYGKKGATQFDLTPTERRDIKKEKILFYTLKILGLGRIKYVFNNLDPSLFNARAWLGRFPHLIAHLKFAAGITPTWFEYAYWCLALLKKEHAEDYDRWILPYLMTQTAKDRGLIARFVIGIWNKRATKAFGTVDKLFYAYFRDKDHPIIKLFSGQRFE